MAGVVGPVTTANMPDSDRAPAVTIRDILDKTTTFFAAKGMASPRLDAELLLAHVLECDRLRLYLNFDRPLQADELDRARALVRRRATFEPVAYILGSKEFAGREFRVGPGVLVPRPDTEILLEKTAELLLARFGAVEGPLRVLEFGVGSGAIAVSLAADLPQAQVIATEISPEAAAYGKANAADHGVADRVDIRLQADFADIAGPFQAIVSNPPYIAQEEADALAPDVREHEPHGALFAEDNGLQWYRFLAAQAGSLLAPSGFLAVEIGYQQGALVKEIFESAGLKNVQVIKDYAHHDRVVVGDKG